MRRCDTLVAFRYTGKTIRHMPVDRGSNVLTISLMVCLLGAGTACSAAEAVADRAGPWELKYANVEPDRLKPPADGRFSPLQNGPGAYLRIVRLRHWNRLKLQVQLKTAREHRMALPVQTVPDVQPKTPMQNAHIQLATLNSARDRLYVYVLVPEASMDNPISVESIKVDGNEITAATNRLAGYNQTGVIPLVVPLEVAWDEGLNIRAAKAGD